jgi:monofunctional glycosyltransferase
MSMAKRNRSPSRKSLLCRLGAIALKSILGAIALSLLLVLPWRWLPLPTSSFMLQTFVWNSTGFAHPYHYQWTPYDEISPYMALAAIAAEDQRFPTHHGFDLEEMERALEDYQQGESLRGASTISQQVAKNLYLWSGRDPFRKGLEAWFTLLIEIAWSKQRILEVYLNIAQLSPHVFGVGAASQQFFDKSASDLTPEEAALFAAVLPGPELYQIDDPSSEVWRRQGWILQQMDQLGWLDYLQKVSR